MVIAITYPKITWAYTIIYAIINLSPIEVNEKMEL